MIDANQFIKAQKFVRSNDVRNYTTNQIAEMFNISEKLARRLLQDKERQVPYESLSYR